MVINRTKSGYNPVLRYTVSETVQYGSALGDLAKETEVVSIPGISGRDPKEISLKSLAYIIQSRMEEILDAVIYEIEHSGYFERLSAGIVLTGGGALLKHLPALVKFKTGLDVRIGYPTECLASDTIPEINHPMYATSVGLIIKGYEENAKSDNNIRVTEPKEEIEDNLEEEVLVEKKESKFGFLGNLKKVFSDIFDEDDAEM